jgi:hypothetical protein
LWRLLGDSNFEGNRHFKGKADRHLSEVFVARGRFSVCGPKLGFWAEFERAFTLYSAVATCLATALFYACNLPEAALPGTACACIP